MTTPVEQSALLAHLRNWFGTGPENLATEALAFILNQYEEAAEAFTRHCRQYHSALPRIDRFDTQDWLAEDGAIPDLIGYEGDRTPLIVEVKFHAGLTPNQPVKYLERLLKLPAGGLLLFIVPKKRSPHVWDQVSARCQKEKRQLQDPSDDLLAGSHGKVRVGVAGWSDVLNVLQHSLEPLTSPRGFWELQQLRSLCEYEDQQLFEPLNHSELEKRHSRRLGEYRDMAYELAERSIDRKLANTLGLARSASSESVGRWFRLKGWMCWLGVHWSLWSTQEHQSPLWLHIADQRAARHTGMEEAFQKLQSRGLLSNDGLRRICIRLHETIGKDRDTVMGNLREQVEYVASLLPTAPTTATTDDALDGVANETQD